MSGNRQRFKPVSFVLFTDLKQCWYTLCEEQWSAMYDYTRLSEYQLGGRILLVRGIRRLRHDMGRTLWCTDLFDLQWRMWDHVRKELAYPRTVFCTRQLQGV